MSDFLYPPIEPYEHGMLEAGDGNQVYWETCGNPDGKPALFVHGGPGWGASAARRRDLDPDRYRYVLFDQRGCGRSTPHAADPAADMRLNTTEYLIADMERLRVHLGIDRWLLYGGSWGSTLILAYAQRYPERVSAIVLVAVTTTAWDEIDWLYHGLRRFLPEQWAAFQAGVPSVDRDGDLPTAYSRLMEDADPAVRLAAADAWAAWEDGVLATEPNGGGGPFASRTPRDRIALVRICSHYFAHRAWLVDGELLHEAHRLEGIPGALIHGKLDLSGPLITPWLLARAWPDAELTVIEDAGHTGSDAMDRRVREVLDAFAT
jgi:proline iminopeptidase